jgi:hypothetical protein
MGRRDARDDERMRMALSAGLRCEERDSSEIDVIAYRLIPGTMAGYATTVVHGVIDGRAVRQFEWFGATGPEDTWRPLAGLPERGRPTATVSVTTVSLERTARPVTIVPRGRQRNDRFVQSTGNAWLDEWFVCQSRSPEVAQAVGDATFVYRFGQLPTGSAIELTGRELVVVREPGPDEEVPALLRAAVALADVVPEGCLRTDID